MSTIAIAISILTCTFGFGGLAAYYRKRKLLDQIKELVKDFQYSYDTHSDGGEIQTPAELKHLQKKAFAIVLQVIKILTEQKEKL